MTYQKLPGLILGTLLVVLALVIHSSGGVGGGAAVQGAAVVVLIVQVGLFRIQVRALWIRNPVAVAAAILCLLYLGDGAVLSSCLA